MKYGISLTPVGTHESDPFEYLRCEYCGGKFIEDRRGNCSACGAPVAPPPVISTSNWSDEQIHQFENTYNDLLRGAVQSMGVPSRLIDPRPTPIQHPLIIR